MIDGDGHSAFENKDLTTHVCETLPYELPQEVVENLDEIEDEGEVYERIEDIWPDYPTKDDFFFHEDEY